MLRRTLIVLSLTLIIVIGYEPLRSVHSIVMSKAELVMLEKQDNAVVRVLKAPFKAIGRIFGRGKKDDNKVQRLSEKDVKKFETAKVTRTVDATSAPTVAPSNVDMGAQERLEHGRVLLDEGNLNEAIAELSLATTTDPILAEAYNLLGVAYHRKGLVEMARRSFEGSLKIDKKNAQTLNNLGYLLYSNGDYKGALDRLKKAPRLAPDDARILNNLALAQSQLGKFDDAYKNFARAGGELNGRLNIANRLELAGRSEEALKHYEVARAVAAGQQANSMAVTVAMEITNGRVTYAAVENRRPGMEAYEASALRIARQRRYPSDKNGQESIVVRVSSLPAS